MLKHHIRAALIALLLPAAAAASAVNLGSEVPVSSQVDLHPASGLQDFAKVASNGHDFVAVWMDLRIQGWGLYGDIFATRIGIDGRPAERFGRRLGPASSAGPNPQIASDGHDYLAVWAGAGGVRSMHLDENGAPLADAQVVAPGDWPLALVFSGSRYLLVGQTGLTLLDRDGSRIRTIALNGGMTAAGAGALPNGAFAVAYGSTAPMVRTIGADGTVTDAAVPLWPSDAVAAAAFSPGTVLMVSRKTASYALVGYDGAVLQPVTPMGDLVAGEKDGTWASAAWDGHEFLAVFPPGKAYRISAAGKLLDDTGFALSQGTVSRPAFASAGTTQLAIWSDGELNAATNPELAGRAVSGFDAFATAGDAPFLTYSGTAQRGLRIARTAAGVFGVWTDDRLYGAWAAFNGRQFALDKTLEDWIDVPVVAAGASSFLVVWRYTDLKSEDSLVGQRFDTNGNALDAEPFIVGEADLPAFWSHQQPSIAFDGGAYLVTWTKDRTLSTVRVGESGPPSDARQIALNTDPSVSQTYSPLALWTGSRYFVLYGLQYVLPSPHFDFPSGVSAVVLNPGPTIGVQQTPHLPFGGSFSRFGAAIGAGTMTFAWASSDDSNRINVVQTALDGTPLDSSFLLTRPGVQAADIAWDGSEFVLIWTEGPAGGDVKLRGLRLGAQLSPLDAEPFDIAGDLGPYAPTVIPTANGVLIGYCRVDAENGFAPRAFTRSLERLGSSVLRRRSAR